MENVSDLLPKLTLSEKARLVSGGDFWHTEAVERLGIPAIMLSDGPYGLRQQVDNPDRLGVNDSISTTCFPPACLSGCSFDKDLLFNLGEHLGKEAQGHHLSVVLGPAVNIKRSPLLGRNFEYISEDPYVAGQLGAALIKGVQKQGVGTSIKHFAANNQELNRMSNSSEVDETTLNEVYLKPFEIAIKKAQPTTIMASYNRINGRYSSENKSLLTATLRKKWGFKGLVISDWFAVSNRIEGLKAGMGLEMPGDSPVNTKKIIKAVQTGELPVADLDTAVTQILTLVHQCVNNVHGAKLDDTEDHRFAQQVAEESIVLLQNNDNILPVSANESIAFIGGFAKKPRFQGGGSSHINNDHLTSAVDAASELPNVQYAEGFDTISDHYDDQLASDALELAKKVDKVVIFAGLPDSFESEGYDRKHLELPANQNRLIHEIAQVQPNVAVILHNGSPVTLPWKNEVKGILEAYLGGQEIGAAEIRILFGAVNPSGKLTETFPKRIEDTPAYLSFGSPKQTRYNEGLFVGYRYYDYRKIAVNFPFGYGLSYTHFEYKDGQTSQDTFTDENSVEIKINVTNQGTRDGKEIVQLYVKLPVIDQLRPVKELRQFQKIDLAAGESKTVSFTVTADDLSAYDTENEDWNAYSGDYEFMVGASSQDIQYHKMIHFENRHPLPTHFDRNTTLGEMLANPASHTWAETMVAASNRQNEETGSGTTKSDDDSDQGAISQEMADAMMNSMPLRQLVVSEILTDDALENRLADFNQQK